MKTLLLAEWVAPMSRAMLRDAAVVFDQRVLAVGPARALRAAHPDAQRVDAGTAIILPGLLNAHAHLELSDCSPSASHGASFAEWLLMRIAASRDDAEPDRIRHAISEGARQCLHFGITSVGDISRSPQITRPVLAQSALRAVSYGEISAMGQRRALLDERLAQAAAPSTQTARLRIGISPHAPYSVELEGYRRCLELAQSQGLPLSTHLAESPDEYQFLSDHCGPFRTLWQSIGGFDALVPRFHGGPIRLAQSLGLLDYPTLLAHVNYCDDEELALLAGGRASIVYCPRTHAFFNHPPHRWRDMLASGVNVAVGTDSCASSPDLNLVDDLRLLHSIAPEVPAETLWQMITTRAAKAMQMRDVGQIVPGAHADLAIFPASTDDPLLDILEHAAVPQSVWIAGQRAG